MARYRITLFFEVAGDGWSESYGSSLQVSTTVVAQASNLAYARMALSPQTVDLTHVRISDDTIFRDIILNPMLLPISGSYNNATHLPPWNAVLVKMQNVPTITRNLFLRGIPADQISGNSFVPIKGFLSSLNAYLNLLQGGGFAIFGKDLSQNKQPISSVSGVGAVVMQTGITGLAINPPNNQVEILGVHRSLSPQRVYALASLTDTSHFTLRGWPAGLQLTNQGFFRLNTIVSNVVLIATTAGVTERRVGRPFGVPRGRRALVR